MNKKSITAFHRRLHRWYGNHGRKDLPWRHTADAYEIYVSEIMLQQTQVKTVQEGYYFPFLERFPTLSHLAAAQRTEILQVWQGLGYYNRAANLHEVAKRCRKRLPQTIEGLTALPGIGRNTAHAIAVFAYHQPVAVMEANVRRVLSRIFALKRPTEDELWDKAHLLLDKVEPFDYNQAMMDIGAMVCTKRAPHCPECPAQAICKGKISPESYPAPKSRKALPIRRKHIAVLRNAQGQYYVTPRSSRFLHGLYHFVETNIPLPSGWRLGRGRNTAQREQASPLPNPPPNGEGIFLGSIRQQYSHFTLEAEVYLVKAGKKCGNHWHDLAQLQKLPMSMAEKKILRLLEVSSSTSN